MQALGALGRSAVTSRRALRVAGCERLTISLACRYSALSSRVARPVHARPVGQFAQVAVWRARRWMASASALWRQGVDISPGATR